MYIFKAPKLFGGEVNCFQVKKEIRQQSLSRWCITVFWEYAIVQVIVLEMWEILALSPCYRTNFWFCYFAVSLQLFVHTFKAVRSPTRFLISFSIRSLISSYLEKQPIQAKVSPNCRIWQGKHKKLRRRGVCILGGQSSQSSPIIFS